MLEEVDGEAERNEEESAKEEDKGESIGGEGETEARENEIARGEDRAIDIGAVMAPLTLLALAPLAVFALGRGGGTARPPSKLRLALSTPMVVP